ncbi:MAG: DUF1801 domain-containing protein [Flavobacteriales bacterium]|nr:DUF1801 domain-containing protein [Flavobacteriales bacterium]MCB9168431.1 DUF1801 domain-containing protein [Flavobacteriales bacterium]
MPLPAYPTIDAYLAELPPTAREKLVAIRETVRKLVPKATETISYGIPAFRLNDRMLLYFAGFKAHVSIYPIPRVDASLTKAIAPFRHGRGTLRFALDEQLPIALIKKVVEQHVKDNVARTKAAR